MSQRWYYRVFGEEFGPVTGSQIQQLLHDGMLSAEDKIRQEAFDEWLSISEAIPVETDDAGEIADLSELAFSFEDSGPTVRRAAYSSEAASSTLSNELAESDPVNPRSLPFESTAAAPAATLLYYCQSLGQLFGPMPVAELVEMASSGTLGKSDSVRCGESGEWMPASDVRELELSMALLRAEHVTEKNKEMSSTTQKRLGAAAVAGLSLATSPAELQSAATTSRQENIYSTPKVEPELKPARSGEHPVRKKPGKKKGKKADDAVIDEIFDEVFAEEEKPQRSTVTTSAAASAASAETQEEPSKPLPVPSVPYAPSFQSSGPSGGAIPAARFGTQTPARLSSPGKPYVSKKSSFSFNLQGPATFVLLTIVVIGGAAGSIYQFGLPSFSFGGTSPEEYPVLINSAIAEYKTLGAEPSEAQWKTYAAAKRSEFRKHYYSAVTAGAADPKSAATTKAMKSLLAFVGTGFKDKEVREKHFAELETLASAIGN